MCFLLYYVTGLPQTHPLESARQLRADESNLRGTSDTQHHTPITELVKHDKKHFAKVCEEVSEARILPPEVDLGVSHLRNYTNGGLKDR